MFKGNGSATCFFFAGSLLFNEQYGDVSNVLQKKRNNSLLLTVVIYPGHFPTFLAQQLFFGSPCNIVHIMFFFFQLPID